MAIYRTRSIPEYLQVLWRRKLLIFLMASVMLISTLLVIAGIPNVYESRALVVISGQQTDDRQERERNGAHIASMTEQLTSRSTLETFVARHNLYGAATDSDTAIEQMRKDFKFETKLRTDIYPRTPQSFTIAYRHTDPATAQAVVKDFASLFEEADTAIHRQRGMEAEAVDLEIAALERQLQSPAQTAPAAAPVQARTGRSVVMKAPRPVTAKAESGKAESGSLQAMNDKQYALEQQIAEQRRQIAEQIKADKAAGPANSARGSNSHGVLLVRKAELEAQIKEYAAQYTDKNPKVIQAQTQLAEINRQIAELTSSRADAPAVESRELRALQRELVKLETDLEITRREIDRKTQAAGQSSESDKPRSTIVASTRAAAAQVAPAQSGPVASALNQQIEFDRLRKQYNALLDRRELLKTQLDRSNAGAQLFKVVDSPSLPQAAVAPKRFTLNLIALGLSLVFGLLVAIAIEAPRMFAVQNARDVEFYLGRPVVALIPEILTTSERGRRRRLRLAGGVGLLVLAAVLIPLLFLFINNLRIFQVLASR